MSGRAPLLLLLCVACVALCLAAAPPPTQVLFTNKVTHDTTFQMERDSKYRIRKGEQGIFLHDPNDFPVGHALNFFGESDLELCTIFDAVLDAGDTVIDVGAHQGTFTVPLAQMVGPKGSVYAIEPQRLSMQILQANLMLNEVFNVHTVQAALVEPKLSGKETNIGDLTQNTAQFNPKDPVNPQLTTTRTPTTTIDELNIPEVRLIKMDTGAMNYEVFLGAAKTIKKFRPCIVLENHDQELTDTLKFISELKYYDVYRFLFTPKLAKKNGWEYADSNLVLIPKGDDSYNMDDFPPGLQKMELRGVEAALGDEDDSDWEA